MWPSEVFRTGEIDALGTHHIDPMQKLTRLPQNERFFRRAIGIAHVLGMMKGHAELLALPA